MSDGYIQTSWYRVLDKDDVTPVIPVVGPLVTVMCSNRIAVRMTLGG